MSQDDVNEETAQTPPGALRRLGARSAQAMKALWIEIRCLYFVFRNPQTPWYVRTLLFLPLAYLCSPVQLIPNFIPVLGQLDDVFVIWLSNKLVRRLVDDQVLQQARERATAATFRVGFSGKSFYVRRPAPPQGPGPADAASASDPERSAGLEPPPR
jgi:uncharacterized membrane protein YkvA (DUF1232 family)